MGVTQGCNTRLSHRGVSVTQGLSHRGVSVRQGFQCHTGAVTRGGHQGVTHSLVAPQP